MKFVTSLRFAFALMVLFSGSALRAQVEEGQKLEPELGVYMPIDEAKWGAAEANLRIVNNNFQMYFLDADKLLIKPPLEDVIVHYSNFIKKSNADLTIVLKKDGMMLTSNRVISPPYRYQVRVFLKKMVTPTEYYKEPYEEKEYIGMHMINQLGGEFYDKSKTEPVSVPVEVEAAAEEPVKDEATKS
ncbi:hypothetical protein [Cerasicoccus arenae]|nr:hypothetical protein [Cerasicoccus arenae]MBK1857000.1 hypothetical protein [Cerasicoccus arenae]